MEIIKVVLTGGPCAGKTTALNSIREYLGQNNIPYIAVPETATELILNGIKPLGGNTAFDFQSLVMEKQLSKEKIALEYITRIMKPKGKCIIIYDRGLLDNKAYLPNKEDFNKISEIHGQTEIDMLDSYDYVFDLLSTATCKPEAYNLLNKARMEDVELATKIDEKTSLAWIAHRNLKVISSLVSLEEETNIILEHIRKILSGVKSKEIGSFLIDDSQSDYNVYNEDNSQTIFSTKYFLNSQNSNYNYVIEIRKINGYISYIYKVYREEDSKQIITEDRKINEDDFNKLISKYGIRKVINTKEIYFIYNMQRYKLCFYEGKTILEIEYGNLNSLSIPDNLKIVNKEKRKCRRRSLKNGHI